MNQVVQQAVFPPCLIPKHSFAKDGRYIASQCPGLLDSVKVGEINVILERPCGFDLKSGNLVLREDKGNNHNEPYHVVICATGWDNSLDFLSDEVNAKLFNKQGQLHLFEISTLRPFHRWHFLGIISP